MLIGIWDIAEYYGNITVDILKEVLTVFTNTTGFTFNGKQYGIEEKDLIEISDLYAKITN